MPAPVIVSYRASWPDEYALLERRIRDGVGARALRIDHVGSTAVPGLAAKDVIDVQVSVATLDGIVEAFAPTGLRPHPTIDADHRPALSDTPEAAWAKRYFNEAPGERRANVHVRVAGAPNARYALLFRDYLRADPIAADAYRQLKERLATIRPAIDSDDYSDIKDPVCDLVLLLAERWASETGWRIG